MPTSLLVVTPSPSFGEQIRRSLEDTGAYQVHVVNSKAAAIVRADEESCRMAFLDLDLGDSWVEEVGQSLRTVIPNIKLFILAGDETPAPFDALRPWTLIRKPFHLPELLQTLGLPEDVANGAASRSLLWLTDVNKAAQHLTRLTLESSSQAALITREGELWAYAGQLSNAAAQEVAKVLARNWDAGKGGDLLRFARLDSTKAEHMLYATQLAEGMLLAMVFDAETPFSTIRSQAGQLATSLAEGGGPEDSTGVNEEAGAAPSVAELEGEDEYLEMPPISEILKEIPIPDPPRPLPAARVQAPPPAPVTAVITEPPHIEPAPTIPVQIAAQAPQAAVAAAQRADAATTKPSIFTKETAMPIHLGASAADATIPHAAAPASTPPLSVSPTDATVASQPRPETPVQPVLSDLDETRPSSARVELASSDLSLGSIVLEPITAGVYHLSYACLLLPRIGKHFLTGDIADKLSEWIPIICVAFGWRLEYLAVRPEYLQWVVNVPPAASPGYVMRVIRQQLSDKIFAAFPRLKRDNPSGDFWAPGYLIMGGAQPHPPQLVKDYMRQIRQRQGIEKPLGKTPRS